jgi:hypothetical protein
MCIVVFFTHLLYGSNFLFHKEKDANIFQQETFHEFRKEAMNQVNSSPPLDTDKDDDLAKVMLGSLVMEDFSVPFAGNCDESTTPESTQEYPSHDNDLDLDASEMAMLELLVLCDSSGARCSFYDDLLTLLRRHVKKGFIISKAKG